MASPNYTDIDPRSEWVPGDESDLLMLNVSGFTKEQLKVQVNTTGKLFISGECAIDGDHWCRFRKDFKIPNKCNIRGIQAKFDEGILYVILPKQRPLAPPSLREQGSNQAFSERPVPEDMRGEDQQDKVGTHDSKLYGILSLLRRHNKFIAIIILLIMLLVGLGVYARYKLKSATHIENGHYTSQTSR